MKEIYRQSYWFWVVSKIILAILLLISTLSILGAGQLRTNELVFNLIGLIEGILLVITLFQDFSSNSKFGTLKVVTGGLLILLGIGLFILLLTISEGSRSSMYILGYPFSIWMILIGIFDLLKIKKATTDY